VTERITRRSVVSLLVGSAATASTTGKKTRPLPMAGEFVRFIDPVTENTIVRLTSLASNNFLPSAPNRFVSTKDRVLVFSSDREGKLMPYQVDLHTGVPRRIAEAAKLDPGSLTLIEKKQAVCFRDGETLIEVELGARKAKTILTDIQGFCAEPAGSSFYVIRKGKLEQMTGRESVPLADKASGPCLARPHGRGCLFERQSDDSSREFWYAPEPESGSQPVQVASGRIRDPFWSASGDSLLFLRDVPKESVLLSEIHEVYIDKPAEACVAPTSQFGAFSPNEDGSVFVGASRSKAQPNIILLLRDPQREMTLCEHRASQPAKVRPSFSPDSRRVYFQSDHQGKSAIYSVNVELLVEPTESLYG
jgi:oligogalacturonide lyase